MQVVCIYCKQNIAYSERPYFSRQAGMRGWYHWDCFVARCHEVNSIGAEKIAIILEEHWPNDYQSFHPANLPTTVLDE